MAPQKPTADAPATQLARSNQSAGVKKPTRSTRSAKVKGWGGNENPKQARTSERRNS